MKKIIYMLIFILFANINIVFATQVIKTEKFDPSNWKKNKHEQPLSINAYDYTQINTVKSLSEYSDDVDKEQINVIKFGTIDNLPIEWYVVEKRDGKALLLSKTKFTGEYENYETGIDFKIHGDELENKKHYDKKATHCKNVTWENCSFRKWLNSVFYINCFNDTEKKYIIETYLNNSATNITYTDDPYGTFNGMTFIGNNTKDKVFLLSVNDCNTYKNIITKIIDSFITTRDLISDKKTLNVILKNDGTYGTIQTTSGQSSELSGYGRKGDSFRGLEDVGEQVSLWISMNNGLLFNHAESSGLIAGMPQQKSELRNDEHFYLDNKMQKSTWVYYITYYYHVDSNGNIEKNKWIEQRYVGEDGRMYRGRQTPDGKWVGDDGLVVNVNQDLSKSLTIEAAEPDSWYKTQSGLWYYFENDRTTTKKGWFIDNRDNQTYYLDPSTGIMAVGWTKINGNMYYFNELHNNTNNWYETGGGFYESYGKKVKAYGSMFKDEVTPDGRKIDKSGKLIN